jgi:small-conductance mechanosensitive channel
MIAPVPFAPAALGLPEWAGRLGLVALILLGTIVALWLANLLMARMARRAAKAHGARARQRQTAITALATGIRYAILVAAAIAIAAALAGGGNVGAVGGGALVVIVIGFASQRLLFDVIAGFFILFEDQYGVGDVVRLEPSGYTGRVDSLGLRTTVLLGPGAESMTVPNGQITAIRVYPEGRRHYRLEMLTRDPEAVEGIVAEVAAGVAGAGGPWEACPRMVRREGDGGLTRLIAIVDADAFQDDTAPHWLADAVAQRAGDRLASPPLVTLDRGRGPAPG